MARPELSLVIPIYNEEEVLPQLDVRLKELLDKLAIATEIVFVNDGSRDRSIELLREMAEREPRYRVIGFSRNFGHQRAITAGMDKSRGAAVVVMDADLQDPPEVILQMVEKWRSGYDVVYGRRRSREGESWFKLVTAKAFYRLFAAMIPIEVPLDTGDFRLMSRRVVLTLRGLRETHRFVRGLVAWVGFKQTAVEYDRAARAAGTTKYPLRKMLAFAIDGIASFSILPLRAASYLGVAVAAVSILCGFLALVSWWLGHTIPGWTTTVVLMSVFFSVQFMVLGILGEYVGRIYEQVKRRPLYVVAEQIGATRTRKRRSVDRTSGRDVAVNGPLPPAALPSVPPPVPPRRPLTPLEGVRTKSAPPLPVGSALAKRPPRATPPPPRALGPALSSSVANIHVALPKAPDDPGGAEPAEPPDTTKSAPPELSTRGPTSTLPMAENAGPRETDNTDEMAADPAPPPSKPD